MSKVTKVQTALLHGLNCIPITVEVDVTMGLPSETIIGMPDSMIKESKNRIRSAITNSGFSYPPRHYIINLAPAKQRKGGTQFDLAMAIAILTATKQFSSSEHCLYLGELSLDGSLLHTENLLAIGLDCPKHIKTIIAPKANEEDLRILQSTNKNLSILSIEHLKDCHKPSPIDKSKTVQITIEKGKNSLSDVKGQDSAKRGLSIAATGLHNCLLIGPPGSGKTMLAERLKDLLPPLNNRECLDTLRIHNAANESEYLSLLEKRQRPFRRPHHNITLAGLIGGGANPKPGEISLAHNGTLFFDELSEFSKQHLEALRQPLESLDITISRSNSKINYPANLLFLATMNPCPCGYFGDSKRDCHCSPSAIHRYWQKISGPILDRIDLIIEVPRLDKAHIFESKKHIKHRENDRLLEKIQDAQSMQSKRNPNASYNAKIPTEHLEALFPIEQQSQTLLKTALEKGKITARSLHKCIKIARSIADLEQSEDIKESHIAESLQFRKELSPEQLSVH